MIEVHVDGIDRIVADFTAAPVFYQRALIRSFRRGLTSGRAFMASNIARDTGLKVGDVRDEIHTNIVGTDQGQIEAKLAASLERLPLSKFNARGPLPSRGQGRVTYRLGGSRQNVPGAFMARMKSGHTGVFKRATALERTSAGAWGKNLPIIELRGPSLGHVFAKYRAGALETMADSVQKNFDHEIERNAFTLTETASGAE